LYGAMKSGHGNKHVAKPKNVKGLSAGDDAQPPFLLRWAPCFFAEMLPSVFSWDASTNKVSLLPDHVDAPPWKSRLHHRQASPEDTWLYCAPCHQRLFPGRGEQASGHIPFRDKDSAERIFENAAPTRPPASQRRASWKRGRARFARTNAQRGARLNVCNLVPTPRPDLWQHAPEIPFHDLHSEDRHGLTPLWHG
jgi:hypothetical protein